MRIQKFSKKDPIEAKTNAPVIAILADEIWREYYTPIIGEVQVNYMLAKFQSAEQIYSDIENNDYVYFTALEEKSEKSVGYCAVKPFSEYLLLSKLYIHKDFRGKGIGGSFLKEITQLCKQEYGLDKIRLTVNKYNDDSIAVYKKMGFETVESVKSDIGGGFFMDDYIMELTLSA